MKKKIAMVSAALGLILMAVGFEMGPVPHQKWALGASFGLIALATVLQMVARPYFTPDRWPALRQEKKMRTRQPGQIHLD